MNSDVIDCNEYTNWLEMRRGDAVTSKQQVFSITG